MRRVETGFSKSQVEIKYVNKKNSTKDKGRVGVNRA